MHIKEIRRAKLRKWFATRSIPPAEKSYISQLMKEGNAFGERAARRLESTYGMGDGYLDIPEGEEGALANAINSMQHASPNALHQAIRLLVLFESTDERGRADMLRLAETLCRPGDESS